MTIMAKYKNGYNSGIYFWCNQKLFNETYDPVNREFFLPGTDTILVNSRG